MFFKLFFSDIIILNILKFLLLTNLDYLLMQDKHYPLVAGAWCTTSDKKSYHSSKFAIVYINTSKLTDHISSSQ